MMMAGILTLIAALAAAPATGRAQESAARDVVDLALERMGGADALGAIRRARFDLITQWQMTGFRDGPYDDAPSYELDVDVRDYSIGGWRNTRKFAFNGTWRTITDVVRDSVAERDFGQGVQPLNVAYVDERDELFLLTPDRLMLALRDAPDLRLAGDTTLGGLPHRTLRATLDGVPVTVLVRRADGLPAVLRFHAAAPNDFGLVPWGAMDVEVWYSNWTTYEPGISLPRQWDVRRVGRPYKRITLTGAAFDPVFEADSFAVDDAVRAAFHATAERPMHDLPLDSARVLDGRFADFRTFGTPAGAVRLGDRWVLLETGQAPLSLERALDWMEGNAEGPVALALVGAVWPTNGGAPVAARRGLPMLVGPGAEPYVRHVLANHGVAPRLDVLDSPRTLTIGGETLSVERIDLPNAPGSIVAWAPSLRWVWAPDASTPLDLSLVRERARERGWDARWIGNRRNLRMDAAPGG